ncbi:MAG: antitoxin VbhA family protein [Tatlockia sp.]|nr:antitoxin VbhA family protein [Tatlockia sp.]
MRSTSYQLPVNLEHLSEQSKRALANLNLEGIKPTPALLADMKQLDNGLITEEQFLQRAINRAVL